MKLKFSLVALIVATIASGTAMAVQKDITVTADVDPSLEITAMDGSALPSTIAMAYVPGSGFNSYSFPTAIFANDKTKGINVKMLNAPMLSLVTDPTKTVPLKVSLGGTELTTADKSISAATLGYNANNKSLQQNLVIEQKTKASVPDAGQYQGMLSLVLSVQP
jgi:hypothetical protein